MLTRPRNLADVGAIGSAKTAVQARTWPFFKNMPLLRHEPSSVWNH